MSVILQLVLESLGSVLLTILLAAAGAFIVWKQYVPDAFSVHLSRLFFYIILPSFLFMKISASVNVEEMRRVWFIVVAPIFHYLVFQGIGWLFFRVFFPTPGPLGDLSIASVAFHNAGNLPLVLIAAVASSEALQQPDITRTPTQINDQSAAYISIYGILSTIILWVIPRRIFRKPRSSEDLNKDEPKCEFFADIGRGFLQPPVIAAIAGLVVGFIPPVRELIHQEKPPVVFKSLVLSARLFEDCMIPINAVILGASLMVTFRDRILTRKVPVVVGESQALEDRSSSVFYNPSSTTQELPKNSSCRDEKNMLEMHDIVVSSSITPLRFDLESDREENHHQANDVTDAPSYSSAIIHSFSFGGRTEEYISAIESKLEDSDEEKDVHSDLKLKVVSPSQDIEQALQYDLVDGARVDVLDRSINTDGNNQDALMSSADITSEDRPSNSPEANLEQREVFLPTRLIVLTSLVRLVIIPLLVAPMTFGLYYLGLFPGDRVLFYMMLLQTAMPSAMALNVITQLLQIVDQETCILLFWMYMASLLTLSVWCTIFLSLVEWIP